MLLFRGGRSDVVARSGGTVRADLTTPPLRAPRRSCGTGLRFMRVRTRSRTRWILLTPQPAPQPASHRRSAAEPRPPPLPSARRQPQPHFSLFSPTAATGRGRVRFRDRPHRARTDATNRPPAPGDRGSRRGIIIATAARRPLCPHLPHQIPGRSSDRGSSTSNRARRKFIWWFERGTSLPGGSIRTKYHQFISRRAHSLRFNLSVLPFS